MKTSFKTTDELPLTLQAEHIADVLGISRAGAYNLMSSQDFPVIKIGKRLAKAVSTIFCTSSTDSVFTLGGSAGAAASDAFAALSVPAASVAELPPAPAASAAAPFSPGEFVSAFAGSAAEPVSAPLPKKPKFIGKRVD